MAQTHDAVADFATPEIIYCGFQRISPVPRSQQYDKAAALAAAQEITIQITLTTPDAYSFAMAIHKQADVQTLARTVESTLVDRRIVVACLVDKGSNNVLRWSDTVNDVLDSTSTVEVIPLFEVDILHTMELVQARPYDLPRSESRHSQRSVITGGVPNTAPLPQLEFMHLAQMKRAASLRQNKKHINSDMALRQPPRTMSRKGSETQLGGRKMSSKTLRALQPTAVRRPSDIAPDSPSSFYSVSPPPLPASPMPDTVMCPLAKICSNSIALLAFCRFCVQKKTFTELLFWLDTTSKFVDEDFVFRVYLSPEAPLRLNIPREITNYTEARELLRAGILAWCEEKFQTSQESLRVKHLETGRTAFYRSATITLAREPQSERKIFISLLSKALDPEDTSILSLKERKTLHTRQAILQQVCAQYFPNNQVDIANYFEYRKEQLTKPERSRLAHRKNVYAGLFDKTSSPASSKSSLNNAREVIAAPKRAGSLTSRPVSENTPEAQCTNPSESNSSQLVHKNLEDLTHNTLHASANLFGTTAAGYDVDTTPSSSTSKHHKTSGSFDSSMLSDDTHNTPGLSSNESHQADVSRRQSKLRSLLGDSPKEIIAQETSILSSDSIGTPRIRSHSPTPSVVSHLSATSSRMSLTRAEKDEANERRIQARRAAKLYAMFGEHADSASTVPAYRGGNARSRSSFSDSYQRPGSSASQYSPAFSRAPSRAGSTSAQSLYSPTSAVLNQSSILSSPDSRYRPDRENNRKTLKRSFGMFRHSKPSSTQAELLSDFPAPPSSNDFNRSPRGFSRNASSHQGSAFFQDDASIMEVDSDEEDDDEGDAIVQDVRTNMKLRQLLGNDAPTSTIT
ncbi:protein of unknown function [Taphrina deformans PYCC 5710]|uniref:RGS domain-containing protein n=1 Tax=Taphrina deformans (strain PYCC 5710 / ATCC 11124 / CBS 356.35 / IMI 108563 / JCM 9778 / NBRC 8474) TaxID=1097556 RepID=R4XI70_TAPDE|nr:protein of unknown function [Taphrina deformans PYCC 5710]|eukprot:CCG84179.1 protein of unknown function [Taphrina deformans PYCC 5710]